MNEKIRNKEKLDKAIKEGQIIERQIKGLQSDPNYVESSKLREMEEEQKTAAQGFAARESIFSLGKKSLSLSNGQKYSISFFPTTETGCLLKNNSCKRQ